MITHGVSLLTAKIQLPGNEMAFRISIRFARDSGQKLELLMCYVYEKGYQGMVMDMEKVHHINLLVEEFKSHTLRGRYWNIDDQNTFAISSE